MLLGLFTPVTAIRWRLAHHGELLCAPSSAAVMMPGWEPESVTERVFTPQELASSTHQSLTLPAPLPTLLAKHLPAHP